MKSLKNLLNLIWAKLIVIYKLIKISFNHTPILPPSPPPPKPINTRIKTKIRLRKKLKSVKKINRK